MKLREHALDFDDAIVKGLYIAASKMKTRTCSRARKRAYTFSAAAWE